MSLRATPLVVPGDMVEVGSFGAALSVIEGASSLLVSELTASEVLRTIGNANTGEVLVANVVGAISDVVMLDGRITASGVVV